MGHANGTNLVLHYRDIGLTWGTFGRTSTNSSPTWEAYLLISSNNRKNN
jgi:hypothetical protein